MDIKQFMLDYDAVYSFLECKDPSVIIKTGTVISNLDRSLIYQAGGKGYVMPEDKVVRLEELPPDIKVFSVY